MEYIKDAIPYIIILVVVLLIRTFIITPVKVNGESMYDTLDGNEIMILNKLESIKRYDIIVADLVVNGKREDSLIKRIYGLPGETIQCEHGMLYINGKKIEDHYGYGTTNDFEPVKLKSDEYFILGDNRSISLDSRIFGPVNKKSIKGVTSFVIWPINKFGNIE